VARRADGKIPDCLLLLEHDPVVTLGRAFAGPEPAIAGMEIARAERGGKATFHGPGQLVGYPILALAEGERDLHLHLRRIEDLLIAALAEFGIAGEREAGATGVWVRMGNATKKVASIGVAVRRWVTYHGFALNVGRDLRGFDGFDPCGFSSSVMTSLSELLHRDVPLSEAAGAASRAFGVAFHAETREIDPRNLGIEPGTPAR
jgi:lipoate-protein ligase B